MLFNLFEGFDGSDSVSGNYKEVSDEITLQKCGSLCDQAGRLKVFSQIFLEVGVEP